MKVKCHFAFFLVIILLLGTFISTAQNTITKFPVSKAVAVNPDTRLVLTFPSKPVLHNSGQIRIYMHQMTNWLICLI